jgi:Ca2+-binding EF-hand superfamily protein
MAYRDFYGQELSADDVDNIFKRVNFSGSGYIEYSEFVVASLLQKDLVSDEKLRAAFDQFDIDGNGFIDMDELRKALVVDNDIDDYVLQRIIRQVDRDGDNQISYQEFKGMMYLTASQPTKTQKQQWSIMRSSTNASTGIDSFSLASSLSSFQGSSIMQGSSNGDMSLLRSNPASKGVMSIFDASANSSLTLENLIAFEKDDMDFSGGSSRGNSSLSSITGAVYHKGSRPNNYRSLRSLPERGDDTLCGSYIKINYCIRKQKEPRRSFRSGATIPDDVEEGDEDENGET